MMTVLEAGGAVIVSPAPGASLRTSGGATVDAVPVGLEALENLGEGWDGVEALPPNATAFALARWALQILHRNWMVPEDTVPDMDGSIAFWFHSPEDAGATRQAAVQCMNSGELLLYFEERPNGSIKVERVRDLEDEALVRLREFVRRNP